MFITLWVQIHTGFRLRPDDGEFVELIGRTKIIRLTMANEIWVRFFKRLKLRISQFTDLLFIISNKFSTPTCLLDSVGIAKLFIQNYLFLLRAWCRYIKPDSPRIWVMKDHLILRIRLILQQPKIVNGLICHFPTVLHIITYHMLCPICSLCFF